MFRTPLAIPTSEANQMNVPRDPTTGAPPVIGSSSRRRRSSHLRWLVWGAIGLGAAIAVAAVDWGGTDRPVTARIIAGFFALMSAQSFICVVFGREWGLSKAQASAGLYGAVGTACMVPGELLDGLVSGAFIVTGLGFIIASLVMTNRFRREMRSIVQRDTGAQRLPTRAM